MENGQVVIRHRGAERIRRGHLWVYRSDIVGDKGTGPGNIVAVQEEHGTLIGKAFYSSTSQIALRLLTRGNVRIDETFFRGRFAAADALRQQLGADSMLGRLVYSEADLLPGLIVDRYGDRLVVQSLCQSTDRLQPLFAQILAERYQPRSIVFRNDIRVRLLEGLELKIEIAGDPLPEPLFVEEDGKRFAVPIRTGQKTGAYLDQRENRRAARRYARGEALDAFCYTGAFAIHLSDVCTEVEAIDISRPAIRFAEENAQINGVVNVRFLEGNAFDMLRKRYEDGVRYDTIVLDPPAFAKNKESLPGALRGYKEINLRAMKLLRPGGILMTCSCSHHVHEGMFAEILAEAAKDAGCWIRVLERRTQSADHPILLTVPETLYLKCFILQILS